MALDDYTAYGSGDVYDVATQIFNNADNGFGLGADRNGILLLLSLNERDWSMFVHGEKAEYAFNDYGQAELPDAFLSAFGENDWYGGFSGYLAACDEHLTLAASGEPVRQSVAVRIFSRGGHFLRDRAGDLSGSEGKNENCPPQGGGASPHCLRRAEPERQL